MKIFLLSLCLSFTTFAMAQSQQSAAKPGSLQIAFGPHAGIGSTSDLSDLRFSSGFRLTSNWTILSRGRTQLGAGIGFSNSFANARVDNQNAVEIRDYDHRTLLLGVQATTKTTLANWFMAVHGGPSSSKLTVDRSSENIFSQKSAGGVDGLYGELEIGARWPVQEDFVITTSLIAGNHTLDHKGIGYSGPQEVQNEEGDLTLTTVSGTLTDDGISEKLVLKTLAASLGVAVRL